MTNNWGEPFSFPGSEPSLWNFLAETPPDPPSQAALAAWAVAQTPTLNTPHYVTEDPLALHVGVEGSKPSETAAWSNEAPLHEQSGVSRPESTDSSIDNSLGPIDPAAGQEGGSAQHIKITSSDQSHTKKFEDFIPPTFFFRCNYCPAIVIFSSIQELTYHLYSIHELDTTISLQVNPINTHGKPSTTCIQVCTQPNCSYSSTRSHSLYRHLNRMHKDMTTGALSTKKTSSDPPRARPVQECPFCEYICCKPVHMRNHIDGRHQFTHFACQACDYSTSWAAVFKKHLKRCHANAAAAAAGN